MTIELTEPEAQTLLQLLHIAVQAKGLDAAAAGLHFQQKITAAQEANKLLLAMPPLDKPVEK